MRTMSMLRPFVLLGANQEDASDDAQRGARLRDARVAAARRVGWKELPEERLVARERWIVDSTTDVVYALYRGAVFETSSAAIIPDRNPRLEFYLDRHGEPVVLERQPRTWSALEARLTKR